MASQEVAVRKRSQINSASRTMFLWVLGASVVVGIAVVISVSLVQRLAFNEKVLAAKQKTANTLVQNNRVADELKENVRVLNTNQLLLNARSSEDDRPLQAILDALPSDANSAALGASLQEVLLTGSDISLESITVDPVVGVESDTEDTGSTTSGDTELTENTIRFSFEVSSGSLNGLRDLLVRVERSIRVVNLVTIDIESDGSGYTLRATADAYYHPGVTAALGETTVQAGGGSKR